MINIPEVRIVASVGNNYQVGLLGKLPWSVSPCSYLQYVQLNPGDCAIIGSTTTTYVNYTYSLFYKAGVPFFVYTGTDPLTFLLTLSAFTRAWVVGGAYTFTQFLPFATYSHINKVDYSGLADTYFHYDGSSTSTTS